MRGGTDKQYLEWKERHVWQRVKILKIIREYYIYIWCFPMHLKPNKMGHFQEKKYNFPKLNQHLCEVWFSFPLYRWRQWCLEGPNDFLKVKMPVSTPILREQQLGNRKVRILESGHFKFELLSFISWVALGQFGPLWAPFLIYKMAI